MVKFQKMITHLLKLLRIPNFDQITHSCTFGELSHGEVSDP